MSLYQYMRLLGYPASKISILTTYNGQKALIRDVIERRCATHPAFGRPAKVGGWGCMGCKGVGGGIGIGTQPRSGEQAGDVCMCGTAGVGGTAGPCLPALCVLPPTATFSLPEAPCCCFARPRIPSPLASFTRVAPCVCSRARPAPHRPDCSLPFSEPPLDPLSQLWVDMYRGPSRVVALADTFVSISAPCSLFCCRLPYSTSPPWASIKASPHTSNAALCL